jgi:hypothetical protein
VHDIDKHAASKLRHGYDCSLTFMSQSPCAFGTYSPVLPAHLCAAAVVVRPHITQHTYILRQAAWNGKNAKKAVYLYTPPHSIARSGKQIHSFIFTHKYSPV